MISEKIEKYRNKDKNNPKYYQVDNKQKKKR